LDPVFTDKATYSSEPIAAPDGFSPYGFVNMTFEIGKNGTVEIKTLELQHKTYYSVTLAYLMPIIVGLMLGAIGWAILNKKFIK
jgi:uncharacterized membrane protein affecting hemolysin expression